MNINYKKSVFSDLKKIGIQESTRIMDKIDNVLSDNPDKGEPLRGKYKGMFKLRVGDYRIVYTKTKNGILILRIRHRKHAFIFSS